MAISSIAGPRRPFGSFTPGPVPRRSVLRRGAALIAACSMLALGGCSGPGPTYAVFDREAKPADQVPETLPADAWETADPSTARSVGEHDGTSLWLTRADNEVGVCLLAYADDDAWVIGCEDGGGPLDLSGAAGSFAVVPDGSPGPDGKPQLSENVYALGGP